MWVVYNHPAWCVGHTTTDSDAIGSCGVIGSSVTRSKQTIGSLHRDSPETPSSTGFCCVVLKAQSIRECEEVVCRIGESVSVHPFHFRNYFLTPRFPSLQLLVLNRLSGLYDTLVILFPCVLQINIPAKNITTVSMSPFDFNDLQHTRCLIIKTFNRKTCDNIS